MSGTVVDHLIQYARSLPDPDKPGDVLTPAGHKLRYVIEPIGTEGRQAWEADTPEQMNEKLFRSLQHANQYIQCQKRELQSRDAVIKKVSVFLTYLASKYMHDQVLQDLVQALSKTTKN